MKEQNTARNKNCPGKSILRDYTLSINAAFKSCIRLKRIPGDDSTILKSSILLFQGFVMHAGVYNVPDINNVIKAYLPSS